MCAIHALTIRSGGLQHDNCLLFTTQPGVVLHEFSSSFAKPSFHQGVTSVHTMFVLLLCDPYLQCFRARPGGLQHDNCLLLTTQPGPELIGHR